MPRNSDSGLTRAEVLGAVAAHADELRRLGVRQLALFGSVARGEGQAGSDLDFLVELSPKTFDTYMDAKLFLERLFGVRVDLVITQTLKPRLRESILQEAVHAAGF